MYWMAIDIENKELLRKLGYRMNGTWTMEEVLDAIRELEERELRKQLTKNVQTPTQ
jgi:ABC-type glycerol-3-phosphate transport system substrate-binding protein